jgi:hypothetical protein
MKKIRIYENLHVILWLIKDTCWLLQLRVAGTFMVFPTLFMAIYISWKTRSDLYQLLPNLAVTCWISANIIWMLGEFYGYSFKIPAFIFFLLGMFHIVWYFFKVSRLNHELPD